MNPTTNQLTKNSPLYEAIMEHCDDIITIKDTNFNYLGCNRAFLNVIKKNDESEVLNKNVYEVWTYDNLEYIIPHFKAVIENKESNEYKFKITVKGETKIIHQITTPIIHDDKVDSIISISRDITKEEKLKEELVIKNNQLNTILDNVPLLIYMKDKDKNYIAGSKNAQDFVNNGYDKYVQEKIQIDMLKSNQITTEEDNFVLTKQETIMKDKMAFDYEGKSHWYKIIKAPILHNKKTNGLITIARNIDIEKKLEEQKDLFIATLVHDLKNPIIAQISALNLLKNGTLGNLNEEQYDMLDMILESSEYMKEMVFSILHTYKFDNGIIKLKKEKHNISNTIQKCINEVVGLAKSKNVNIKFKNLNDKYDIYIDEAQIRRVIANLLNNGIHYAYNNTDFNIEIIKMTDYVKIKFKNKSDEIDENTKYRIFDKYITNAEKYQKIGFGLGMYLSKKIIDAHDGNIYLNSYKNDNEFIIELPTNQKESKSIFW